MFHRPHAVCRAPLGVRKRCKLCSFAYSMLTMSGRFLSSSRAIQHRDGSMLSSTVRNNVKIERRSQAIHLHMLQASYTASLGFLHLLCSKYRACLVTPLWGCIPSSPTQSTGHRLVYGEMQAMQLRILHTNHAESFPVFITCYAAS